MTNLKHAWQEDFARMSDERSFMGVVTATPGSGTVTVKRKPDLTAETLPKLASYSPSVGQRCWVVKVGAGWLVIGAVG